MFNTLKYARMLEKVGFSREQSEATIHILAEVMEDKLATKQDLKDLEIATRQDIKNLEIATKQAIQEARQEIHELAASTKHDIEQLKSDLIIKLGAMQAAAVGLVVALIKLL